MQLKTSIKWNVKNRRKALPLNKKDFFYNRNNNTSPMKLRPKYYLLVPVVLLIKALRKINIYFHLYPDHFGHQSFDIEYFLRTKLKRSFNIFLISSIIPNKFLYNKHKDLIFILTLSNWLYKKIKLLQNISITLTNKSIFVTESFEYKWLFASKEEWKKEPFIKFNDEEIEIGENYLKKNNLKKFQYVLFSSRDDTYYIKQNVKLYQLQGYDKKTSSEKIINRESSLSQKFRNMNFCDYQKSISFLSKNNIKSVRIGAFQNKIDIKDQNFIDFAGNQRSDLGINGEFLDFYLLHHCKFFVNCSSGLNCAIMTTNRPSLVVNSFPFPWISSTTRPNDMYIPKLYSNDEHEFINFSNLINLSTIMDWRSMSESNNFFKVNKNLTVINNTNDEILNAVKDMNRLVNEQHNVVKQEIFLRSKFDKLIKKNTALDLQKSTICFSFLRKYSHLLN